MPWRKWLVRSLVFSIAGLCASVGLMYQRWTNPAAVREQVIGKLQALYPGAVVTVDSARLRLLGGILVNELRLCRRDDPDQTEFVHVPSAILYHDKEKILDGQIVLRKVELFRPHLRAIRAVDGTWNLQGILGPSQPSRPLPTVIVHQGTIRVEDAREGNTPPLIEISEINMNFINDPLPAVLVSGSANCDAVGDLQVKGNYQRTGKDLALSLKAKGVPIRPGLLQRLQIYCSSSNLTGISLEGKADVDASLVYHFGTGGSVSSSPKEEVDKKNSIPLEYDVRVSLTQGKLQHPKIPLPLENVQATLECGNDTLRLQNFQARSGNTVVKCKAAAILPCVDQFFEADLEVQHLQVNEQLCACLPEKLRKVQETFQAQGPATIRVHCARHGGQWANLASGASSQITLLPEDFRICFTKFPYPLKNVTGTIVWNMQTLRTQVDVTGYIPGEKEDEGMKNEETYRLSTHSSMLSTPQTQPVIIRGTWQGEGPQAEAQFDLAANHVPLDERLITALPAKYQKLTQAFHPMGKINLKGRIHRSGGEFHNEYHIGLYEGTIHWDEFPYPLEQVRGYLDIYPKHWEFREGRGHHHGGEILVQCRSLPQRPSANGDQSSGQNVKVLPTADHRQPASAEGDGLFLEITGRNLALDDDLHKALGSMPPLAKTWTNFQPQGRMNFTAHIERYPDQPQDMDVRVEVGGCSIEPLFFPYALTDLSGLFHFRKNRLEISGVKARHRQTRMELDQGTVDIHPGGGHFTDLRELRIHQLEGDEEFIQALPKCLQHSAHCVQLQAPIDVKTRLVVTQGSEPGSTPDVYWDGQLRMNRNQFSTGVPWKEVNGILACTGRHNGRQLQGLQGNLLLDQATLYKQTFKQMHGKFQIKENTPDILILGLHGPIFGGDITGQVRLELTSSLRYEMNLTAAQIDLQELSKQNLGPNSQLSGIAVGRLHLTGLGNNVNTLDGNGSIDVPNGRLYNLPLLLDLLKFLGLRWPDRTAFEELHALFSIRGVRVTMRRLDLTGNAVSLSGKGEFNLDGTDLNLDFYPSWGRVEQLLPPVVRPLPPAISKNFLTIEMRGKVGPNPNDLKFNKKIVPILFDPLLTIRDRMIGNNHAEPTGFPGLDHPAGKN